MTDNQNVIRTLVGIQSQLNTIERFLESKYDFMEYKEAVAVTEYKKAIATIISYCLENSPDALFVMETLEAELGDD